MFVSSMYINTRPAAPRLRRPTAASGATEAYLNEGTLCVCVCKYIYACMYIYTHTRTHVYIYISSSQARAGFYYYGSWAVSCELWSLSVLSSVACLGTQCPSGCLARLWCFHLAHVPDTGKPFYFVILRCVVFVPSVCVSCLGVRQFVSGRRTGVLKGAILFVPRGAQTGGMGAPRSRSHSHFYIYATQYTLIYATQHTLMQRAREKSRLSLLLSSRQSPPRMPHIGRTADSSKRARRGTTCVAPGSACHLLAPMRR